MVTTSLSIGRADPVVRGDRVAVPGATPERSSGGREPTGSAAGRRSAGIVGLRPSRIRPLRRQARPGTPAGARVPRRSTGAVVALASRRRRAGPAAPGRGGGALPDARGGRVAVGGGAAGGRTGTGRWAARIVGIVSVGGSSPNGAPVMPDFEGDPRSVGLADVDRLAVLDVDRRHPLAVEEDPVQRIVVDRDPPAVVEAQQQVRAMSGCATRRSARRSLPTTTSRPAAKLPSDR